MLVCLLKGNWLKDNMIDNDLTLASSASTIVSLESIRLGKAGLDAHRQVMMFRVPNTDDWARFEHNSLELKDLAYLTARTGDEYAILRGKKEDILFHGGRTSCSFTGAIFDMLLNQKLELVGHSHPGEDDPVASSDDRAVLRRIGQKSSFVISGRTGRITEFTGNPFE